MINNSTKLLGGNNIDISVITVCLNSKNLLENTILSVINQTYKYFEYIIIDGGSSDGTIDIIKKYDKYISYFVSEKDYGIYNAMNKGIVNSKGEIIYFLNAGDELFGRDVLDFVLKEFQRNPNAGIIYGLSHNFSDKINIEYVTGSKIDEKTIWKGMPICHQSMFIKREVFKKIGLYDTVFKIASDYEFLLRFLKKKNGLGFTDFFINHKIVKFNLYGENAKNYINTLNEMRYISNKYYNKNLNKIFYYFIKYIKYILLIFFNKLNILSCYRILKYKILKNRVLKQELK